MPKFTTPDYFHLRQQNSDASVILTEAANDSELSSPLSMPANHNNGQKSFEQSNDMGHVHKPYNDDLDNDRLSALFDSDHNQYYPDDRVYLAEDTMTTTTVSGNTMMSNLDNDDDDEPGSSSITAREDGTAVRFKTPARPSSCSSTGNNCNNSSAKPRWSQSGRYRKLWPMSMFFCHSQSRNEWMRGWNGAILIFALLLVTILSLGIILVILKSDRKQLSTYSNNSESVSFPIKANEEICTTSSCVKAASNLLQAIDFSVNPCDNFYEYACGQWNKDHPIPDDVAAYGTFAFVRDLVRQQLKGLLEEPTIEGKLQDKPINMAKLFYRTCMNSTLINRAGIQPIIPAIEQLGGWPLLQPSWDSSKVDLTTLLTNLRRFFAMDIFLSLFVYADSKNTTVNILNIDKGSLGLGMGTRDYYLNDTIYGNQMSAYRKYLTDIVHLLAHEMNVTFNADTEQQIDEIIDFEKSYANITTPDDQRRNHSLLYNKWSIGMLQNATPMINWQHFFKEVMAPNVWEMFQRPDFTLIVNEPAFLQNLNDLLSRTDKRIVVNYIMWRFLKLWSKILDSRFEDIFQEFAQVMLGRQQKPVRWKHCVPGTVTAFDMAVGALYVKRHFKQEDKSEALNMISHLQSAFKQLVIGLDWMDEKTKGVAIEKAQAMLNHIGYPEFILNQTALNVYYADIDIISEQMTYFEMNRKISLWLQNKDFADLLKPFERNKFDMSPAIVNAFYSPEKNAITFPAGILQPPFFKGDYPKAINYGAMGAVIGHEITHGFDDQGCQYDKNGNLNDWWTPMAFNGFRKRTECIVEQYNNYTVTEVKTKVFVNGKLTQGENIADNGGVKEAYIAYKRFLSELGTEEPRLPGLLNLTNYHLFFLSYANFWCGHKKPAAALQQVLTDPHSPETYRVIGVVSNMDEFADAFGCAPGTPMNPLPSQRPKCRVW